MHAESADQCIGDDVKEILCITAKSGMPVDVSEMNWTILPNKGKGQIINVEWVYSSEITESDRILILEVFMYYVCNMAASTASGVATNVKPYLICGIPSLCRLKAIWSGLKTNHKKGINQFFGTLSKLSHNQFDLYHDFTSVHLDHEKSNALDTTKGALTALEFDSLAKRVNDSIQAFDWQLSRSIEFYNSGNQFGSIRNKVANKLLLSIVRRPIQLSVLKWRDLIPAGHSFNDCNIRDRDELGTIGAHTSQLRVFFAKVRGGRNLRDCPEQYPIHISEKLSILLSDYKRLVYNGLKAMMEKAGISLAPSELLTVMDDVPIFPDRDIFHISVSSVSDFMLLFNPKSMAYHVSEGQITQSIRDLKIESERVTECIVSSNRIRHTVLTRAAQDGLSAIQLARITGVTVPAARHYIDLDYTSRRIIDIRYAGNEFLSHAFSSPVGVAEADGILDANFNPIGAARDFKACASCATNLGKPLGCYGCPNFRPIIEADHRAVLEQASRKLSINSQSLLNPLQLRSVEKLELQIGWVQLTIDLCDEALRRGRALDA